ncbi:MAG: N-acyl-D-amino-acid deacylase family protein [Bacillota bacterium]
MTCDYLIKNGTIVDGSGEKAFKGSLVVKDGKISDVISNITDGETVEGSCSNVLNAEGLTVCPGFIDMHSHADWVIPFENHPSTLSPLLEQGVTTVIGGNCGYSPVPLTHNTPYRDLLQAVTDFVADRPLCLNWESVKSYYSDLEKNGLALNLAMLAGHGMLRFSLLGEKHAYPGEENLAEMEKNMDKAMEEGACGISLGLGYAPGIFSEIRELERFAECARKHDKLLTVHLKAYTKLSGAYPLKLFGNEPHNLKALREMLELAQKTGVKMQISHMLFVGEKTWPSVDQALNMIEEVVENGTDIAFDSFPYTCGNTTIYVVYPAWFLNNIEKNFKNRAARLRLKAEVAVIVKQLGFGLEDIQVLWGGQPELEQYKGLFFEEIAGQMGCSVFDAYLKVSEVSRGKTLCLLYKYNGDEKNEETLQKVLSHPLNLFETDTILTSRGLQNPSSFGTFPRIIQKYHKEQNLFSLEEAISKMTGKSAKRFGIRDRGTIAKGNWADLVIFDYEQIEDNTTFKELERRPSGIKHVFINGKEVVKDGRADQSVLVGQVIRV